MTNVYNISGSSLWSRQLAEELDAADGKKDGKIDASIWNNYMKNTGSNGNHIKNYISVNNAARSLRYYNNKKDVGKVNWGDWRSLLNIFKTEVPRHIDNSNLTNIPKTGDIPQNLAQERMHSDVPDMSNIDISKLGNKETVLGDDGKYYTYDEDTVFIYDSKEQADKKNFNIAIDFDKNNNMIGFTKAEYNEQGEQSMDTSYDAQGNLKNATEYQYNSNRKESSIIEYNSNGEVERFTNYSYDSDGNKFAYDYDENGNITSTEKTDKNNIQYSYTKNGEFIYASKMDNKDVFKHYYWDGNGNLEKD